MFYAYYVFLNIKEGKKIELQSPDISMEYKNVCDTDIYEKNNKQLKCLFGNKIALIHILMLFD